MDFTVSDFLSLSELEGIRLVAGERGIDQLITRTNIMDNPDTFDWLMPGEFLLSTGYIFQKDETLQRQIVRSLAEINCAGLCIKIERYLKKIPACMLEEANRLDFPLIELPFGYSLSTTIGIINRKLYAQNNDLLEGTMSIHREVMRTALADGSLHTLAETLVRLIGNPVLITDSGWKLLCHVDRPDNPFPLAKHINITRKQPPFPDTFIETLPNTLRYYKKAITRVFTLATGQNVSCRILPVAAHNYIYGYLIVWESVRNLTELDYVALEQVAIVAALERIRANEVEQIKLRVRKDFFDDLLSGNIESLNAIRSMAEIHGLDFDSDYRCFIVRYGDNPALWEQQLLNQEKFRIAADQIMAAITKAAEEAGMNVVTLPQGLQFVVLVALGSTSKDRAEVAYRMAQRIAAAFPADPQGNRIFVVVGHAVSTVAEVYKSYRSAQNGIRLARSSGLKDPVIYMDDLAVFQLLSENVDKNVLRHFCQSSIGPLLDYDSQHDSQLLETLDKYFQHNGNISDTAKDLYIHRNTCIYRIEKVKSLLNTELKNPNKLLELQLALLAWRTIAE